jgi:hypothetical protein
VVVPGDPIAGISCFANVAPTWNDTMATVALVTAVALEGSRLTNRLLEC